MPLIRFLRSLQIRTFRVLMVPSTPLLSSIVVADVIIGSANWA
jgi:hypothetical protein